MKDEIKYIFSSTNCLSEEILIKYINDEISDKEKRYVELHLTDCEICQDIYEGLNLMKDKSKLSEITNELNLKIDKKISSRNKIINFNYKKIIPIAASILLIVGLTYFISTNYTKLGKEMSESSYSQDIEKIAKESNDDIFENEKKFEKENQETETIENSDIKPVINDKTNNKKETIEEVKTVDNIADEVVNEVVNEDLKFDDFEEINDLQEINEESELISENSDFADSKTEKSSISGIVAEEKSQDLEINQTTGESLDLDNLAIVEQEDLLSESYEEEKTRASKRNFNEGLNLFDKERYSEAKMNFEEEIFYNPENDSAIFYKALSEYQLQNYTEADIVFDYLLKNNENQFYEDALFYKAMIQYNKGKSLRALELFYQVLQLEGDFYDKAQNKILEIENK